MTEPEIQRLIVALTTALPRDWSFLSAAQQKATQATYQRMLGDLPYDAARAGVEVLLATASRMPTIAEIRTATLAAMHGEVRAGGDAWGDVRKAIGRCGANRRPEFADPVVADVVSKLGWFELCSSDNQVSDRSQFIRLYDQLAAEHRREQNVSALPATRAYRALASGTASGSAVPQLSAPIARGASQAPLSAAITRLLPEGDR